MRDTVSGDDGTNRIPTPKQIDNAIQRVEAGGYAQQLKEIKKEVEHPEHYLPCPYEVYKVLNAWGLSFNLSSAIKYFVRAGKKKPEDHKKDLLKAKQYIDYEIERLGL